jgi:hypothetical protein
MTVTLTLSEDDVKEAVAYWINNEKSDLACGNEVEAADVVVGPVRIGSIRDQTLHDPTVRESFEARIEIKVPMS